MENLIQPKDSHQTNNDSLPGQPELDFLPFEQITNQQMNKALIYFDALTKVEIALANASSATQQAWQNTKRFNREDTFLKEIAYKAQLTDLQLDFIFEIGVTM